MQRKKGFDVKLRDEKISPDVARFYEKDKSGRSKFVPAFVANELLKENVYVTNKSNMMSFRYNPENGVYELFAEAHIQQEVRRKLGKHLTIMRHRGIEHFIKSSTIKDMSRPPEDLIVVQRPTMPRQKPKAQQLHHVQDRFRPLKLV